MNSVTYPIVEIFESLQGEGTNTGMPSIFVRFGKCNLRCPWCDTNYLEYEHWNLGKILETIESYQSKNIIITGGEPSIVPKISLLLNILKQKGYFLAIETNGLTPPPIEIDFIATSPKYGYWKKYQKRILSFANEVRIVVDNEATTEEMLAFCQWIKNKISAKFYYLSPCEVETKMNLLNTIQILGLLNQKQDNNPWHLSIQTHKLIGIE